MLIQYKLLNWVDKDIPLSVFVHPSIHLFIHLSSHLSIHLCTPHLSPLLFLFLSFSFFPLILSLPTLFSTTFHLHHLSPSISLCLWPPFLFLSPPLSLMLSVWVWWGGGVFLELCNVVYDDLRMRSLIAWFVAGWAFIGWRAALSSDYHTVLISTRDPRWGTPKKGQGWPKSHIQHPALYNQALELSVSTHKEILHIRHDEGKWVIYGTLSFSSSYVVSIFDSCAHLADAFRRLKVSLANVLENQLKSHMVTDNYESRLDCGDPVRALLKYFFSTNIFSLFNLFPIKSMIRRLLIATVAKK